MLKLIKITQRLSGISQPVVLANRSNIQNLKYIPKRCVHDDQSDKPGEDKNISHPTAVTSKYEIFRDENATVILDVEEEREKLNTNVETEESVADPFEGLNLKRKLNKLAVTVNCHTNSIFQVVKLVYTTLPIWSKSCNVIMPKIFLYVACPKSSNMSITCV